MSYVNQVEKDGILYDINDKRIPEAEVADAGKVIGVDAQGKYVLKDDQTVDAYTKAETDVLLAEKQNVINDLAEIRSGAEAGATALQSGDNVSALVNDAGYLTEHQSLDNYYTKSEVDTDLAAKQDVIDDLASIREGAAAGATAVQPGDLANVAFSGSYSDIEGTPILANVATTGAYADLVGAPENVSAFINDAGYLTEHQELKTINDESLVGEGNIEIKPGIPTADDAELEDLCVEENIGKIAQYVGRGFNVEKKAESQGRLEVEVDEDTFTEAVDGIPEVYSFIYSADGWTLDGDIISLATYGITATGEDLVIGDAIVITLKDGILAIGDEISNLYWAAASSVDFTPMFESGEPASDIPVAAIKDVVLQDHYVYKAGHAPSGSGTPKYTGKIIDIFTLSAQDGYYYATFAVLGNGNVIVYRSDEDEYRYGDYEEVFENGAWNIYTTSWLFNSGDIIKAPATVEFVAGQSYWSNFISKVNLPAFTVEQKPVPRFEFAVNEAVYQPEKGKHTELIYHEGDWCVAEVGEGTSIAELLTQGSSYTDIYCNTLLSNEEVDELVKTAPLTWQSGSGSPVAQPVNISTTGNSRTVMVANLSPYSFLMNTLFVADTSGDSEFDAINFIDHPTYCSYFGFTPGWNNTHASLTDTLAGETITDIQFESAEAKEFIDKLYSLTPFEYIYIPVDLEELGISVEGTPGELDKLVIDVVDNGLIKYELYRIEEESVDPAINVGDEITTIYFDTTATPDADSFSGLFDFDFSYDTLGFGPIYASDISSSGLFVGVHTDIDAVSGEEVKDVVLFTHLGDVSSSQPETWTEIISGEVLYTSTLAVGHGVETVGWQKNHYTFNPAVKIASSIPAGSTPLVADTNIEAVKPYIRKIPFDVEPEIVYVPKKFYASPDEKGGAGTILIDLGSKTTDIQQSDIRIEFQASGDALQAIKDAVAADSTPVVRYTLVDENNSSSLILTLPLTGEMKMDQSGVTMGMYVFGAVLQSGMKAELMLTGDYGPVPFGQLELISSGETYYDSPLQKEDNRVYLDMASSVSQNDSRPVSSDAVYQATKLYKHTITGYLSITNAGIFNTYFTLRLISKNENSYNSLADLRNAATLMSDNINYGSITFDYTDYNSNIQNAVLPVIGVCYDSYFGIEHLTAVGQSQFTVSHPTEQISLLDITIDSDFADTVEAL